MKTALIALLMTTQAAAAPTSSANTLKELFNQIDECIGPLQLHSGTEMSIRFSLRRDGSLIGKPRVTYLQMPSNNDDRDMDLKTVANAFNQCLPVRITPALGGAIAGRPFVFSYLPAKHEQRA